MTSTPFNVGLGDGSRLSSRVLRPPGGGHTDIFGGDPEPPRGRRLVGKPAPSNVTAEEPVPTNGTEAPTQNGKETSELPAESAQQEKTQTPPKTESEPANPANSEPRKRVRVPPGGFSSGLW